MFFSVKFVFFVDVAVSHFYKKVFSRKTKMKRKTILVVLLITVLKMLIDCSAEGNIDVFSNL